MAAAPLLPDFDSYGPLWWTAWSHYRDTPYREDCAEWIAHRHSDDADVAACARSVASGFDRCLRELDALADEARDMRAMERGRGR